MVAFFSMLVHSQTRLRSARLHLLSTWGGATLLRWWRHTPAAQPTGRRRTTGACNLHIKCPLFVCTFQPLSDPPPCLNVLHNLPHTRITRVAARYTWIVTTILYQITWPCWWLFICTLARSLQYWLLRKSTRFFIVLYNNLAVSQLYQLLYILYDIITMAEILH